MLYNEALESLVFCLENNLVAILSGPPAVGKTDMVSTAVARVQRPLVTDSFATMESVDLRGLPAHSADKMDVIWSRPEFLKRLYAAGPRPVLFIDEATALGQSLQVPMMQMTLANMVGSHALPEGTTIVLAGNRVADRAAAQRMGTALNSRLLYIDVDPDLKAWLAWAAQNDVSPMIRAFLMLRGQGTHGRPGLFHNFDPSKPEIRSFAAPRSWTQASVIAEKAPDHLRFGLMSGKVGEAAAVEFEGFVKIYRSLPPIPSILAAPDSAPLPSEPSTQYAVAVALSRASNSANFAAVAKYMARIGAEFQTVTMTDAVRRNPELASSRAYIDWASMNADVAI